MSASADHLRTICREGPPDPEWIARLEAMVEPACVYFIAWHDGPIKIGHANNVRHRLYQIQSSCPFDLKILATREGGLDLERAYHRRFARLAVRGEWFERHPLILNEIGKLNGTVYGRPMTYPPRAKNSSGRSS